VGQDDLKATNIMILEKDGLMRRALAKVLSDELPPGVEIAVAGDDVLCNPDAVKNFVTAHTTLIGIRSGGGKAHGGSDGSELLKTVFGTWGVEKPLPRPILITFQPLNILGDFHREEFIQNTSLYYFVQLPLKVRELVCLLTFGEVFRD
jgi:hypothetical protein